MGKSTVLSVPNPLLLEKGYWTPDDVIVQQIVSDRRQIEVAQVDQEAAEDNWREIQKKNPQAFAGPTIRLVQSHILPDGKLVLEVVPSDYREGCLLNWLGAAMIPVTADKRIALQASVASIAATIGAGTRTLGCTFPHTDLFGHLEKEMREECNVEIADDDVTILGLVRTRPPLSKFNYCLVVKINLTETFEKLRSQWATAEDKWEGELLPFEMTRDNVFSVLANTQGYGPVTPLAIQMVAESEGVI